MHESTQDASINNIKNNIRSISMKNIQNNKEDIIDQSFNSLTDSCMSSVKDNQKKKSNSQFLKKSKKIIIVDDNKFINDSIKRLIESIIYEFNLDIEVIQVSDGVDLLIAVVKDQEEGNLVECVFTDENMEYMNGSYAIRIMRDWEKSKKVKNLKLFSITGQEDIQSSKAILASGADLVLGKPVSKIMLINCLKDINLIV